MNSLNSSKIESSSNITNYMYLLGERRSNYFKHNKSDIFSGEITLAEKKKPARNNSEFHPKYQEESAFTRKNKEFHNLSEKSDISSCFGRYNKEIYMYRYILLY